MSGDRSCIQGKGRSEELKNNNLGLRGDTTEVYKLLHGIPDPVGSVHLPRVDSSQTMGAFLEMFQCPGRTDFTKSIFL